MMHHLVTIHDAEASTLSQRATRVRDAQSVAPLARDMIRIMHAEKGIGLAAPQVGARVRVVVFDIAPDGKKAHTPLVCVNPTIIKASRELVMTEEGCLSVPGTFIPIVRAAQVTLRYEDLNGVRHTVSAGGLFAVAAQHEIDHLDGILMTDRYAQQKALRAQFVPADDAVTHRLD